MDGQSQLSDIQTYLATFNPKDQAQIILQQPDGSFIKGEEQNQIDDGTSLDDQGISDQPLLTPAAPSIGDDQLVQGQHIISPDQSSILVSQAGQETGSDAAVQVRMIKEMPTSLNKGIKYIFSNLNMSIVYTCVKIYV